MRSSSINNRILMVGLVLVAAVLACSAPSGQAGETPTATEAVAEVVTTEPPANAATEPVTAPPAGITPTVNAPAAPAATGTTCGYDSKFVSDVSIPDGSPIQVGTPFTKTWQIKNSGCQTWPTGTSLAFVSGNQMSGPASVPVPQTAPGGTQNISVNLTAPSPAGDYQGYWQLSLIGGSKFGDQVYIKIKSTSPAAPTETTAPSVPPTATTPPPLPPPAIAPIDFTADYIGGLGTCGSAPLLYVYMLIVTNTGVPDIQSASWVIEAPPGTQVGNGYANNPFMTSPLPAQCSDMSLRSDSIPAGQTRWIPSFTIGTPIPGGTAVHIKLKLCSEDGLSGQCKSVTVSFTA